MTEPELPLTMAPVARISPPLSIAAKDWGWRPAGRERWTFRSFSLSIPAGQRVLLLGPSGAGKSTLLAGLSGVLGDEEEGDAEGVLTVGGQDARTVSGQVGLLMQNPESQIVQARIGDDVAFGPENLGVPPRENWRRVRETLRAVGLGGARLSRSTSALSGGQQQRLALAGVLAMQPGALLLDEPTANLDPEGAELLRDTVLAACADTGATLVVVEHRIRIWAAHVDRVIAISPGGVILADGSPEEVFAGARDSLRAAGIWLPEDQLSMGTLSAAREQHSDQLSPQPSLEPLPGAGAPESEQLGLASRVAPALVARELSVGRDSAAVLTGVELLLQPGTITALTGPNGAGKSTLGLTLAGLLRPLAGSLSAHWQDSRGNRDPNRWRSAELAARIGVVFQNPEHQFVTASVRAELALGPRLAGLDSTAVDRRVRELSERLGLSALIDANPFTLSGGEQRRLSVATALGCAPEILILDEPTFGQDAQTWQHLVELLREEASAGTAVLAITHDEALMARADRVLPVQTFARVGEERGRG